MAVPIFVNCLLITNVLCQLQTHCSRYDIHQLLNFAKITGKTMRLRDYYDTEVFHPEIIILGYAEPLRVKFCSQQVNQISVTRLIIAAK